MQVLCIGNWAKVLQPSVAWIHWHSNDRRTTTVSTKLGNSFSNSNFRYKRKNLQNQSENKTLRQKWSPSRAMSCNGSGKTKTTLVYTAWFSRRISAPDRSIWRHFKWTDKYCKIDSTMKWLVIILNPLLNTATEPERQRIRRSDNLRFKLGIVYKHVYFHSSCGIIILIRPNSVF